MEPGAAAVAGMVQALTGCATVNVAQGSDVPRSPAGVVAVQVPCAERAVPLRKSPRKCFQPLVLAGHEEEKKGDDEGQDADRSVGRSAGRSAGRSVGRSTGSKKRSREHGAEDDPVVAVPDDAPPPPAAAPQKKARAKSKEQSKEPSKAPGGQGIDASLYMQLWFGH